MAVKLKTDSWNSPNMCMYVVTTDSFDVLKIAYLFCVVQQYLQDMCIPYTAVSLPYFLLSHKYVPVKVIVMTQSFQPFAKKMQCVQC